jgi:hypothetical protein
MVRNDGGVSDTGDIEAWMVSDWEQGTLDRSSRTQLRHWSFPRRVRSAGIKRFPTSARTLITIVFAGVRFSHIANA